MVGDEETVIRIYLCQGCCASQHFPEKKIINYHHNIHPHLLSFQISERDAIN